MKTNVRIRVLPAAAVLFMTGWLATGCSFPLPQAQSDPTRFYVLSMPGVSAKAVSPNPAAPVLRLRAIELASYLTGRSMVVRRGENELEFREFARWGEPLEQGISRELREELIARGAASAVQMIGFRSVDSAEARYELTVRVLACEGLEDGGVNFRAVWELAAVGENPGVTARGEFKPTDLRWTPKHEATLAAALSQAVAGLAGDIAGGLTKPTK